MSFIVSEPRNAELIVTVFVYLYLIKKSLELLAIEASDQKRISGCSYRHRVTREKEDMSFIVSVRHS